MNIKEIIKKLKGPELPDGLVMVGLETRQKAIEALEKQIPKKPKKIKAVFDRSGKYFALKGDCPVCGAKEIHEFSLYCDKCGQKLDWKDGD